METGDKRVSGAALGANCDCTGSGAPVNEKVKEELQAGINFINSIDSERSQGTAYEVINNCTAKHGFDTCMNAEASLRINENTTTLCVYDKITKSNLAEDDTGLLRQVVKCTPDKVSNSSSLTINENVSSGNKANSPSVQSSPKSASVSQTAKPSTAPVTIPPTKSTVNKPSTEPNPTKTPAPATDTSSATTSTTSTNPAETPPVSATPEGNTSADANTETANAVDEPATSPSARVNEGCVAIEHLQGYALQHSSHLWRPVYCTRGICATKHHALIVDGVYTSMKQLCAREDCVQTSKYVNNLNVFKNRHVQIAPGVIATPYDVRFPQFAIWLVQGVQYSLTLVAITIATTLVVLAARARKSRVN